MEVSSINSREDIPLSPMIRISLNLMLKIKRLKLRKEAFPEKQYLDKLLEW